VEGPKKSSFEASVSKPKDQKKSFRQSLREWGFYIAKQPRAALKDD